MCILLWGGRGKGNLCPSPEHAETHNNLAVTYYNQDKFSLAIIHSDIAAELGYTVNEEFLKAFEPYRD